ncbi:LacI family DNA-binding transcriptional regulator [Phyllobacterium sp. SB3]|uniref:LacI family DNA-binding transcriptional regulator n=1 Tax=Phyllobacterium sp. SB3 TaxID=3156073 RepID=UPI0032B012C6
MLEVANRLGYRASTTARSLRTQRSWTICMLVGDIANTYYAEIVIAVEEEAWRRGYSIILANTQFSETKQTGYVNAMLDKQVDGLILASHNLSGRDIEILNEHGTPVVFLSRFDPKLEADKVGVENAQGARLAVEHLLSFGHRRIAFIGGRQLTTAAYERYNSYKEALVNAGVELDPLLVAPGNYSQASGAEAARHLLSLPNPPTAIFCANDLMAIGVIGEAKLRGIPIPEQLSVVGFDNIEMAEHPLIQLTTIHVPRAELGQIAVSTLCNRIEGKSGGLLDIRLAPHLISRATVAPPPLAKSV